MRFVYTDEQIEYVRFIAEGKYNDEITKLFNKRFGVNVTESQISSLKKNHKIRSNVSRARPGSPRKLFTDEQAKFIRDNVKGISNQELADLINEKFGLTVTREQVRTWKHRRKISSGLTGHFKKGHVPVNKGTKGMFNVGGNKTSFKPGQRSANYKPVGYERIDKDGYILVKVQDEGDWHERWRHKHKIIWEKENGPVPKGHKLLFADSNKQNVSLDNLVLVSDNQLLRMNQNDLIKDDPELTKTGIIVADLISKIGERERSDNN